jgi:hypothetical protein
MTASTPHRPYRQSGWTFWQVRRGSWLMVRDADGFATDHNSKWGCQSFIRQWGNEPNPDAAYEKAINDKTMKLAA